MIVVCMGLRLLTGEVSVGVAKQVFIYKMGNLFSSIICLMKLSRSGWINLIKWEVIE